MVALKLCFISGSLFRFNLKKMHEMIDEHILSKIPQLILFLFALKSVGNSYDTSIFNQKYFSKYVCLGSYNKINYTVLSLYNLKENA